MLVVEEIPGVHEHIKERSASGASRSAATSRSPPELFARQGDPTKIEDARKIITDIVAKDPDREVMADLDATVAWAGKNDGNVAALCITASAGAGASSGSTPRTRRS